VTQIQKTIMAGRMPAMIVLNKLVYITYKMCYYEVYYDVLSIT